MPNADTAVPVIRPPGWTITSLPIAIASPSMVPNTWSGPPATATGPVTRLSAAMVRPPMATESVDGSGTAFGSRRICATNARSESAAALESGLGAESVVPASADEGAVAGFVWSAADSGAGAAGGAWMALAC